MHLVLGRNYERTIVGNRENAAPREGQRVSPAIAQLLFTFATKEQAGNWSVRQLAEASGLSKSNVAKVRQQLVDRGVLRKSEHTFEIRDKSRLHEEMLRGYELALRPKLLIGRFRSADSDLDAVLTSVRELSIRWSVTGGPAAHALQKFYRGLELPIFVDSFPDQLRRRLRIIPDKSGPLIFLRSFGTVPFWRETGPLPLAHPWLIYSELNLETVRGGGRPSTPPFRTTDLSIWICSLPQVARGAPPRRLHPSLPERRASKNNDSG
jgi:hypothetical protein